MKNVLVADRRPDELDVAWSRRESGPPPRSRRWLVLGACGALFCAALGFLLVDAAQANHGYDHSRHVLAVTRGSTDVVSRELAAARIDLHLVTAQVGNDTTALAQDTSQLKGAQSALSAAQAHVFEQASLLEFAPWVPGRRRTGPQRARGGQPVQGGRCSEMGRCTLLDCGERKWLSEARSGGWP